MLLLYAVNMLNIEAYWFFEDFKRANQMIRDKVIKSRKKNRSKTNTYQDQEA